MVTRYLYGDSDAFPLDYDFLKTLESFVEHGGRAAHHDACITDLERSIASEAKAAEDVHKVLAAFTSELIIGIQDARTLAPAEPVVLDYAGRILAFAESEAQSALDRTMQQAQAEGDVSRKEIEEHRAQMRDQLDTFLLQGVLGGELVHAKLTLKTSGGYDIEATRRIIGGTEVTYRIDTSRFAEWTEQRTVESVSGAMEIQVGMKKKFLRKDLTRELMRVGDHIIVEALMDRAGAQISIKKKLDSPKGPLTLMLSREDDQLDAYIERQDNDVFPAVPSDAEKMSGLWEALERVARQALDYRDAVIAVRHGDEDLLEGQGIHALVGVLMEAYAPIARNIDRKSPASRELSLKLEHESGRREELYLDKDTLRAKLDGLHPTAVQRMHQLPLEDRNSRVPPPPPVARPGSK